MRLPPVLHATLQRSARAAGLSVNEYCIRRLWIPATGLALTEDAPTVVHRAHAIFGDALIGVVVCGSWMRGEAHTGSDVDLLVVVESRVALARDLYRAWDEAPLRWEGRPVDPHFVHPPGERIAGGVWGEVAIDGVVLFERALEVSGILARVRREIAAARLVRRVVHGQPYWTEAA